MTRYHFISQAQAAESIELVQRLYERVDSLDSATYDAPKLTRNVAVTAIVHVYHGGMTPERK